MVRPSKGLTERVLLRMSEDERAMVHVVWDFYGDELDSANSAIRQCIWDGYNKVVALGADPISIGRTPAIDGQTEIDISQDGKETK